jgi:hypothetical protein
LLHIFYLPQVACAWEVRGKALPTKKDYFVEGILWKKYRIFCRLIWLLPPYPVSLHKLIELYLLHREKKTEENVKAGL